MSSPVNGLMMINVTVRLYDVQGIPVEILSLLVWRLSYVLLGFMYLNECRIVSQSIMNTHL